jgi:hypothetical protein
MCDKRPLWFASVVALHHATLRNTLWCNPAAWVMCHYGKLSKAHLLWQISQPPRVRPLRGDEWLNNLG